MGFTPREPTLPSIENRTSDAFYALRGKYMRALEEHVITPFRADILEIQGLIREELKNLTPSEDAPLLRKALEHRLALTQQALQRVEEDFATLALQRLNDVSADAYELVGADR